jgi:hypothetical protein
MNAMVSDDFIRDSILDLQRAVLAINQALGKSEALLSILNDASRKHVEIQDQLVKVLAAQSVRLDEVEKTQQHHMDSIDTLMAWRNNWLGGFSVLAFVGTILTLVSAFWDHIIHTLRLAFH